MERRPAGPASHYLYPCTIFAHREEHVVSTVLGSCVTVCLRDPVLELGGINHYMLPLWNGEGLPTPKYGNIAIEKLLRRMFDLGCARERLIAKLFGGANVIGTGQGVYTVGARNIALARELLAQEGIKIAAADVGGESGRKVIYNTRTGVAMVSCLRRLEDQPR
jgi:chemotaxis protein CheD